MVTRDLTVNQWVTSFQDQQEILNLAHKCIKREASIVTTNRAKIFNCRANIDFKTIIREGRAVDLVQDQALTQDQGRERQDVTIGSMNLCKPRSGLASTLLRERRAG